MLKSYQVEILEAELEDMLWVKLNQGEELVFAVYYVPAGSSSRGRSSDKYFQILAEQLAKFVVFGSLGPLITCGDFNARCREIWT